MTTSFAPTTADADRPLGSGRKVAFASGELAFNLTWQSIELFLLFYYTDVVGLSPWWAGVVFAIGSFWDGFCDPIIGAVADRTRTRWGRFRPWVVGMMPVVAVALAAVFYKPALAGAPLTAYALITHLILRTAYTSASIPYLSLSSRITQDGRDRSTIAGYRMQFAAIAGLTVSLGYPFAADRLGRGDPAHGYFLAAVIFGCVSLPFVALSMWAARDPAETPVTGPRAGLVTAIGDDLKSFARMARHNGPFMRVLIAITLTSIALTMISKATLYYFKYYLNAPGMARYALALSAIKFVVLAPVWAWFANRTSKRTAWLLASFIAGSGALAVYFVPTRDPYVAIALLFYGGIGSAGYAVLFWAMLPDTVEVNELLFGERDEAKAFSFALFARKLALAFNALLLGALLSAAGFRPNEVQSEETLWALKAVFTLIPAVGALGAAIAIWGYRLDGREHRRLREEIRLRKAAAS